MRDDLRETYQIRYTETGGILIILNHTETIHGMYKCCETYRPDNFVDTSIPPQDASSSLTTTVGSEQVVTSRCQQSSPPSTTRESKTASSSLVSITMCLAIIAIVLAVISFGFSMKKILLFSNKDNQRNCVSALKYTALSSSDIHVA
ncbi:uncharacterized protein LOC127858796 [Dreissena polymorpha]|nr:uncharacterized protein LOC127858796 [Dreissena polymorpha]